MEPLYAEIMIRLSVPEPPVWWYNGYYRPGEAFQKQRLLHQLWHLSKEIQLEEDSW